MTAITKLLPLFALLVTLVSASPEPRADQLDDVKRQVEDPAQQSRGDISDDSGQLERALHGEYLSGAKEDTLYCGPPGSPVSLRPICPLTQLTISIAMSFNPTTPSPFTIMIMKTRLSKHEIGPVTRNSVAETGQKGGSGTVKQGALKC